MAGQIVTEELEVIRQRTRKWLYWSIGAHALLFLMLSLYHKIIPEPLAITEITWIDPVEAATPALPVAVAKSEPAPAEKTSPERPSPRKIDDNFKREQPLAELAPDPQSIQAIQDKLSERLASLQRDATTRPKKIASLAAPSPVGRPKLAGVADDARTGRQTDLTRTEVSTPNPIALTRSRTTIKKAAVATPVPKRPVARAQNDATESAAQREVAGAQMTGPVADRPIISYNTPVYPEWAKSEGVQASVMIYFVVLPDGHVKENVMVQKTSGFTDFDDNAVNAILAWRFAPLKGSVTGEQWGTIMFHYRLTGGN
ncbi:MAG: TonB family protein [Candidatus Krumholzibacteria bacterium]